MSGWSIIISQATPEERDSDFDTKHATLATWDTDVGGLQWIETLVKDGRATQLQIGGYPTRFTILASEMFPILENWPPTSSWIGEKIYPERLAACPPHQLLTIEAWDLS